MCISHVIYYTNYATARGVLYPSAKIRYHENSHGKSNNYYEIRYCVANLQQLWKHEEYWVSWRHNWTLFIRDIDSVLWNAS